MLFIFLNFISVCTRQIKVLLLLLLFCLRKEKQSENFWINTNVVSLRGLFAFLPCNKHSFGHVLSKICKFMAIIIYIRHTAVFKQKPNQLLGNLNTWAIIDCIKTKTKAKVTARLLSTVK